MSVRPCLTEALKTQAGELAGELLAVSGDVLCLPGRVLGIGEHVLSLGVARPAGQHPRRLLTLPTRPGKLDPRLVALLAGPVKPSALLLALIRRLTPRPLATVSVVVGVLGRGGGALPGVLARHLLLVRQRDRDRRHLDL